MHVRQRAEQETGRYHIVVADGQFAEDAFAADSIQGNAGKCKAAYFGNIGACSDADADIKAAPVVTGDWCFLDDGVCRKGRRRQRDEGDCSEKELGKFHHFYPPPLIWWVRSNLPRWNML